jgi:hypothetical protein
VSEPTLSDVRELLDDLYHEAAGLNDNSGGHEGELFRRAHDTLRWFLNDYLFVGERVRHSGSDA